MSLKCIGLGVFAALLAGGTVAYAQSPTVPVPLAQCPLSESNVTANLTSHYQSGNWANFQKYAIGVVLRAQGECTTPESDASTALKVIKAIDPAADYVVMAWVAKNQFAENTLYSAILHATGTEPYTTTLPGVGAGGPRLFQVFISSSELDAMPAVYVSVRENNPLVTQLPTVVEAIVNPLFAALSLQQGDLRNKAVARAEAREKENKATPAFFATFSRVNLPFQRAAVVVEMRASIVPLATAIGTAATNLAASLKFSEAPYAPCAQSLADRLARVMASKQAECVKKPDSCGALVADDFKLAHDTSVGECRKDGDEAKSDRAALAKVDETFRKLVTGLAAKEVPAKLTLKNVPLQRYSFGLLAAYLPWAGTKGIRVKMDDGKIVADPLKRQISMAVLNGAFQPYDPTRFSPSNQERHRWFVGAVITPDIGVGGGYSFLIVRGLAANIGGALIAVTSPAEGETVDSVPKNPKDPFQPTVAGGLFVGASYNFK
jgi:hypothetical protein